MSTFLSLYTDGCCNKVTKGKGWGNVVDEKKNRLLDQANPLFSDLKMEKVQIGKEKDIVVLVSDYNDVKTQNNNGAELDALLAALRIATTSFTPTKYLVYHQIFTDSKLLLDYWSKGHINPMTRSKMDPKKLQHVMECAKLRHKFEENGGKVLFVSGKDNLADLGFHKK